MENYFNYFTEIEEQFQRRRGGALLLSTLDWSLIEVWKDAGIPLEAVLRGIDVTFDHYDAKPSKSKKVNSLAFCTQEVLAAAEDMKEAAVGGSGPESKGHTEKGFQASEVASFLRKNAESLDMAALPVKKEFSPKQLAAETAEMLRKLAQDLEGSASLPRLEDLERRLTVAEEKLFAVLLAVIPDEQIVRERAEADRELAPYRSKMSGPQIEQLQKQFVHKRLLEKYGLPRLSLFYM